MHKSKRETLTDTKTEQTTLSHLNLTQSSSILGPFMCIEAGFCIVCCNVVDCSSCCENHISDSIRPGSIWVRSFDKACSVAKRSGNEFCRAVLFPRGTRALSRFFFSSSERWNSNTLYRHPPVSYLQETVDCFLDNASLNLIVQVGRQSSAANRRMRWRGHRTDGRRLGCRGI